MTFIVFNRVASAITSTSVPHVHIPDISISVVMRLSETFMLFRCLDSNSD